MLQREHAAAMEMEFEKLVKKFEARKSSLVLLHRNRTAGLSSLNLPSAAQVICEMTRSYGVNECDMTHSYVT